MAVVRNRCFYKRGQRAQTKRLHDLLMDGWRRCLDISSCVPRSTICRIEVRCFALYGACA